MQQEERLCVFMNDENDDGFQLFGICSTKKTFTMVSCPQLNSTPQHYSSSSNKRRKDLRFRTCITQIELSTWHELPFTCALVELIVKRT